jgi:shikimate kinase/3-dehydroquinate synthase
VNHIILTGFMGTGKTSVGRQVARRLRRPFLDMDAEIAARVGKPIPRIFAEDGEAAFRALETRLCKGLSRRRGLVIATGGGTLVNPANRDLLLKNNCVICLNCHPDEILRRLEGSADRPLLAVADPRAEVERLLEARHEAYASLPWQIDTTGLSLEAVVAQVLELAAVITLDVRHASQARDESAYPVHVGRGVLSHLGDVVRAAGAAEGSVVAVVCPPPVARHHLARAEASLRAAGLAPFACSLPDGEVHKTLATVAGLYEQWLAGGLDRTGTVVALGGGVTGDVAGFAAATYMRGVRLVQVPTTLLAMVDASVGGKTGVDLPHAKNIVGAFKQPAAVVIDPDVLSTLPAAEMRSGLAEVIKHGIIGAPELFAELQAGEGAGAATALSSWWSERGAARIAWALQVKIQIVEQDPFEQGRRAVLNLGHTTAHALEQLSGYTMRHGEAVAIGLVAAARIAEWLGRAKPPLAENIEAVLAAWGLPVRCPPYPVEAIWQAMGHDKKRRGKALRWVLPHAIGRVEITEDVPRETVWDVLCSLGARRE